MSSLPKKYLTPEQYLEIERKAEYKSEYHQGEMFAMSGARVVHTLIAGNAFEIFRQQLRLRGCQVVAADLRVQAGSHGLCAYPDLVAYCGDPQLLDGQMNTLLNPVLIVEVLSPSTEMYDRTLKWEQYQTIESLSEYLLISSDRVHVDLFTRQPNGGWEISSSSRLADTLDIPSIECVLRLADLYDEVRL